MQSLIRMIHHVGLLFAIALMTLKGVQPASLDTLFFKSDKIVCPGGGYSCDDQSTCCQLPNDEWACCVFPNAQCCSDRTHCCPQGSTCDTVHKSCHSTASNVSVPAVQTKSRSLSVKPAAAKPEFADLVGLYCPDRSTCPYAGAACCRTYSGRYTCCNYPLNVCCDDGLHCCHIGTVCDPIRYVCIPYPGSNSTWTQSWTAMTPAYRHSPAVVDDDSDVSRLPVVSSDSKPPASKCREGHTCCVDKQGNEGLCVLDGTGATCCEDGLHCCPQGSTCDLEKSQCTFQKMQAPVIPWSRRASLPVASQDTVCPDGDSKCDDGFTCCPVSGGGGWGCCPLTSAVCCSDMRHCCPQGTHCTAQGTCATSVQSGRFPWSALVYDEDIEN